MSDTNSVIVVTEGGSLMDDTSTGVIGYVGVGDDAEGTVFELMSDLSKAQRPHLFGEVIKHWDISPSNHVFA